MNVDSDDQAQKKLFGTSESERLRQRNGASKTETKLKNVYMPSGGRCGCLPGNNQKKSWRVGFNDDARGDKRKKQDQ